MAAKTTKRTGKKPQKNSKKTVKKQAPIRGLNKKLRVISFTEGEVTYEEKKVVIPVIIKRLRYAKRKKQAMTNEHLRNSLLANNYVKVNYRTLQKLIHYIRVNGLLKNLIAGSNGYYIGSSAAEIENYIKVLKGRVKELNAVRRAIEQQSEKIRKTRKK